MHLNNKGYILVTSLMVFSIIITITMMCIGLNYSNKSILRLEYKNIQLKEDSLSGLELVHSNIVNKIKESLIINSTEELFRDFLSKNEFVDDIKDISRSDLKNIKIQISNKSYVEDYFRFDIYSEAKDNSYSKKFKVSVKIMNPYVKLDESLEEVDVNIENLITLYNYKEI